MGQQYLDNERHEAKKKGRSDRSLERKEAALRLICDIVGPDTSVSAIDYDICLEFRNTLARVPKNKVKIYGDMPIMDAVEAAEMDGRPTMKHDTQEEYLRVYNGIIRLAVKKAILLTNPAEGLSPLAEQIPASEKRNSFTLEQLQSIFSAPLYTGCVDDRHNFAKPGPNIFKRARYWVPLIFLFSGMRPNEICSLYVDNIKMTDKGTNYFEIVMDRADKQLKTSTSRRVYPIHSRLIRMGFLDYVKEMKKEKNARLFPELTRDKRGFYSTRLCDWFLESFLKNTIKDRGRRSFYSLRHNFANEPRKANAPDWVLQALGAWDKKAAVSDDYGEKDWPDELADWVEKIQHPGLDLQHLYTDTP